MKDSEVVALSEDNVKMRPRLTPDKWPIEGPSFTFSNLKVDVPEFVPGQAYTVNLRPKETGTYMNSALIAKILWLTLIRYQSNTCRIDV